MIFRQITHDDLGCASYLVGDEVAGVAAVVKGIERERAEIDVAPLSLRAGALLSGLAPVTSARIQRRLGSAQIARAMAEGQRGKR